MINEKNEERKCILPSENDNIKNENSFLIEEIEKMKSSYNKKISN